MKPVFTVSSLIVAAGVLGPVTAHASAAEVPDRTIRGHSVLSTHDPEVLIRLPASATYVADELAEGGSAHGQWSANEAAVIARAQRSITLR